MTDLPVGPELDRAVALAIGWKAPTKPIEFDGCELGWCAPNGWGISGCSPYELRAYSTDPATQGELISWLRQQGADVTLDDCKEFWQASACLYECRIWSGGDTINAALCYLALDVAEMKAHEAARAKSGT